MSLWEIAHTIEQYASLGVVLVGGILAVLAFMAWRRERERRMITVAVAYILFAISGLLVFIESWVADELSGDIAELIENSGAFFVLAGLIVFFVAITRE